MLKLSRGKKMMRFWSPQVLCAFIWTKNVRYQQKGIWVIKNGKPERINIVEGISDDNSTEIISPLIKVGDTVITGKKSALDKTKGARLRMPR